MSVRWQKNSTRTKNLVQRTVVVQDEEKSSFSVSLTLYCEQTVNFQKLLNNAFYSGQLGSILFSVVFEILILRPP